MALRLNGDKEIVARIRDGLKAKGGYCPCRVPRTPEYKCMCEEFRQQLADPEFEGYCHCMLFYKTKDTSSVLYGKTAIFDGDSISQGDIDSKQYPWAKLIGEKNGMNWKNYSVGGGTVTAEQYAKNSGAARHWISRTIDKIHEDYPELDYLILEGGTNDADLLAESELGEFKADDFSGNYTDTTFTGALETLFFKALKYYPNSKIGFIIAPKMGVPSGELGPYFENRRRYFLRAMEICKKWNIPYVDLWETSWLDPFLTEHYAPSLSPEENEQNGKYYKDGQHLTSSGYAVIVPLIEEFMKSL